MELIIFYNIYTQTENTKGKLSIPNYHIEDRTPIDLY